ncbi:hypothetical protein MKK58_13745 [Methylobacterium sp. J-078]|uniref:hypothetical protein n=1 Tax=Methylobacterium sp. J-078 TaxID=2836657 RepID=UPI001FBB8096|nr:hypothetical protein [Methylobacterium sp. J-078]MCJ2045588.1 hypothetical protein [Methylobacterium sp. J-078]
MSEQSEAEVARHRALEDLTPALRHLTANLMRITRGAGHPYRLVEEMVACLRAMQEYRDAIGYGPSTEEIQAALNPEEPETDFTEEEMTRRYESGWWDRERAIVEIRRAGLAMTAAMLVNQRLQISRAETDMRSATDRLEEAHETLRKFHAARRAAAPVQRPKKRSPGRKA